ncbi:MAG: tryptophan-rich sensory protein [Candidatus Eremiobacteraeota bacterium]|nr:tryptophan-rich sensory protein [Candidatus Eremiobacteraeota bacterium]
MRLLLFVFFCHACGHFSARLALPGLRDWFCHLKKPEWHPPAWVFAKVWLLLYTLMGIAGWRLYPAHSWLLCLWLAQLGLNQLWTYLFFVRRSPGLALIDNLCLWATLGLYVVLCWPHDPLAAALLVPEWLWIGFASSVNYATWKLNR